MCMCGCVCVMDQKRIVKFADIPEALEDDSIQHHHHHHHSVINNASLLAAISDSNTINYPEMLTNNGSIPNETLMNGLDTYHVILMYLVHALPYAQSALNWLFYAFLNRNLRHSSLHATSLRPTILCNAFRSPLGTTIP